MTSANDQKPKRHHGFGTAAASTTAAASASASAFAFASLLFLPPPLFANAPGPFAATPPGFSTRSLTGLLVVSASDAERRLFVLFVPAFTTVAPAFITWASLSSCTTGKGRYC